MEHMWWNLRSLVLHCPRRSSWLTYCCGIMWALESGVGGNCKLGRLPCLSWPLLHKLRKDTSWGQRLGNRFSFVWGPIHTSFASNWGQIKHVDKDLCENPQKGERYKMPQFISGSVQLCRDKTSWGPMRWWLHMEQRTTPNLKTANPKCDPSPSHLCKE